MYEIKSAPQIDTAANLLIQLSTSRTDFVRFDEGAQVCPRCCGGLGVYYCENGTYAVRCLWCETITLVKARNPADALQRVGILED